MQATGRVGRDGKQSFCYLFYREEDRSTAESVLRLKELPIKEKAVHEQNLDAVRDVSLVFLSLLSTA